MIEEVKLDISPEIKKKLLRKRALAIASISNNKLEVVNANNIYFYKLRIAGDGSCLFHSLSASIEAQHAKKYSPQNIRSGIIETILYNLNDSDIQIQIQTTIENDIPESDKRKYRQNSGHRLTIETYPDYMNRQNVWGGSIEIYMATILFNCDIFVYNQSSDQFIVFENREAINNPLYLHYNGNHYDILLPIED